MSPKISRSGGRQGGWAAMMTPTRIIVLLLAALTLIFIFENTHETEIRLLVPLVTMPLWSALLATGIVGALCGALFMNRRR